MKKTGTLLTAITVCPCLLLTLHVRGQTDESAGPVRCVCAVMFDHWLAKDVALQLVIGIIDVLLLH